MKVLVKCPFFILAFIFLLISVFVVTDRREVHAADKKIDLTALSIEELMDLKITSVARKPQKLSDAASAVYVITQEDIRRSGLTSIPDMLRMVPGLQVAQITSSKWAITSRGFNSLAARYLLVLVDGINVYSPTFSGVNWDEIDTLIEDIERIEIIRGPGATMWGADAVNGVVNIITKSAGDTNGGKITAGGGDYEEGFGSVRYGGGLGEHASYRAYVKYFNRNSYEDPPGEDISDRWYAGRAGFRVDWDGGDQNALTLQGDWYSGEAHETLRRSFLFPPYSIIDTNKLDIGGGNLLTRWKRIISDTSDMQLQLYYYHTVRDDVLYRDTLNKFDADFQHRFGLGKGHDIVWGLRYNFEDHELRDSPSVTFDPDRRRPNLFSGFIQDEIALAEDHLYLILGTKVEHNDYTGFEIQPSGRLLWKPHHNHTLWGAVSRSVKTPNRINRDFDLHWFVERRGFLLTDVVGLSNGDFDSEECITYELGYRADLAPGIFMDLATFLTEYDDVLDYETDAMDFFRNPPRIIISQTQVNAIHGHTYGAEIAFNCQMSDRWKLTASYTLLQLHLSSHVRSGESEAVEGASPENQCQIHSFIDLPWNMEFDSALYYVDHLSSKRIPSYVRLDARIGWQPASNVHISLALQNLLDNHHPEFRTDVLGLKESEVTRSIYLKTTWLF